jgi:hypothetical protein
MRLTSAAPSVGSKFCRARGSRRYPIERSGRLGASRRKDRAFRASTADAESFVRLHRRHDRPRLTHFLDVTRLPGLVEGSLGRSIYPQNHEIALAWQGPKPVLSWTRRRWPKVDVRRPVGVLGGMAHRIDGGKWLPIIQPGRCHRVVHSDRSEQRSRNALWQIDAIAVLPFQEVAVRGDERGRIFLADILHAHRHAWTCQIGV